MEDDFLIGTDEKSMIEFNEIIWIQRIFFQLMSNYRTCFTLKIFNRHFWCFYIVCTEISVESVI